MTTTAPAGLAPDDTIRIRDLGSVLDRFPRVKLLSLDCFDTILWRKAEHPADVFYDMQQQPAWKAVGLDARLRIRAEMQARSLAQLRRGSHEVTLEDIYRAACDDLEQETLKSLQEVELQAEERACHAMPQAVTLLRAAAARGVQVMVVSDTYLTEPLLRRLLAACLPADAYAAIHRVCVSCEYGTSKADGLFPLLARRLDLPVARMLHVGDNPLADVFPARAAGIACLHLQHLPEMLESRQQFAMTALRLLEPDVRSKRGAPAGYHPVIAGLARDDDDTDRSIGIATLGPLMHAFASWLLARRNAQQSDGKRVKLAFLLRDGYLPHAAYEALSGETDGRPVYVSRFAAFAASFRDAGDIERYLALFATSGEYAAMLKQLGLQGEEGDRILDALQEHSSPQSEFSRRVLHPRMVAKITERSARYRARLRRHLECELGLERGDTLAFVDLGYVGTAQRVLAPVMRDEWGVELLGWYFMCTPQAGAANGARCGMIDASKFDARTIDTLLPFVSLLENLCTTSAGSVVDYGEDGTPILSKGATAKHQTDRVRRIQAHALDFIRQAEAHYDAGGARPAIDALRDAALAEFARMVFFPDRQELAHYDRFALELNLGTDRIIRLHDTDRSLQELRHHGIFYSSRQGEGARINPPHELRHAGIELALAMMSTYRFGLAFRARDWSFREEPVSALLLRGNEAGRLSLMAYATYDGCYRLHVPIGEGDADVGLLLGERFRWLQLIEARVLRAGELRLQAEYDAGIDVRPYLLLDGITDHGDGLLQCATPTALMMLPAGLVSGDGRMVLDLVLRPLSPGHSQPQLSQPENA
ncbi:MAG: hypothetical protein ACOY4A_03030 [Pseudomonadota bacterium]